MLSIHPFKAIIPRMTLVSSPDSFFNQVKEQFSTFFKAGYFETASDELLFVYKIVTPHRSHIGLIAAIDIKAYLRGNIVKHEQTLAAKEDKSLKIILERSALIKPVLLTFPDIQAMRQAWDDYTSQPVSFQIDLKDGTKHCFWAVNDGELIREWQTLFTKHISHAYIADGHHRMAAMARYYALNPKNDRTLVALFPDSQLQIWDYNRILQNLNGLSALGFIAKVSEVAHLEPQATVFRPTQKHELGLYIEGQWFKMTWRKEVLNAAIGLYHQLDVSLLNTKILADILNITDIRNDQRVLYVEGLKGIENLPYQTPVKGVAFALYPVDIREMMAISDEGLTMPPKSTWFEPRIKNGFTTMSIQK